MDIPKKSQRFFLLTLMFLIMYFQYPRSEHMIGNDSFNNMGMSRVMMETGEMPWYQNGASPFGLYPFSYPAGIQTLASGLALVTHIPLEICYLLISGLMVFLGAFGMFMLAGEINRNFVFKYSAAFSFAICPVVLKYSTWSVSSRGPFILMLPFFIFFLLKAMRSVRKTRAFLSAVIFLVFLISVHHMGLLLPLLILAILAAYITSYGLSQVKLRSVFWAEASRTLSLILLILISFLFYLQFEEISRYRPDNHIFSAWFLNGNEFHIMVMNGLIFYTMSLGSIIIFAGLGLGRILEKIEKNPGEWSLLFVLLFFGNFLLDITYMVVFMVPLLIPFIGAGINETVKRLDRQQVKAMGVFMLILLLSTMYSGYTHRKIHDMDFQRNYGSTGMVTPEDKSYNTMVYINLYGKNVIVNEHLLQRRILGYTACHAMPFENWEYPIVAPGYVENASIERYTLGEVYEETEDTLWYLDSGATKELSPSSAHTLILSRPIYYRNITTTSGNFSVVELLARYNIKMAVYDERLTREGKTHEYGYTGIEMLPPYDFSWFFNKLPLNRYVIYKNDHHSIYWL